MSKFMVKISMSDWRAIGEELQKHDPLFVEEINRYSPTSTRTFAANKKDNFTKESAFWDGYWDKIDYKGKVKGNFEAQQQLISLYKFLDKNPNLENIVPRIKEIKRDIAEAYKSTMSERKNTLSKNTYEQRLREWHDQQQQQEQKIDPRIQESIDTAKENAAAQVASSTGGKRTVNPKVKKVERLISNLSNKENAIDQYLTNKKKDSAPSSVGGLLGNEPRNLAEARKKQLKDREQMHNRPKPMQKNQYMNQPSQSSQYSQVA